MIRVVFLALLCAVLTIPTLAEDKASISTESVVSKPYKRASLSVEKNGWTLTPGAIASEGLKFGFTNLGYHFKRELEHGGELFVEPHVGLAKGIALGTSAVLGGRIEAETHNWLVASWVDTYRGGSVQFTTCEPLAEVARHVGKGFFFGASSSCYIGSVNETTVEIHGHHEVKAPTEYIIFVGPTAMFRHKKLLVGASYEVGRHNERFLAGFVNIRWQ